MSDRLRLARRVAALMEWDEEKTRIWFQTSNPMLGGVTPEEMIHLGRVDRLEKFIAEAEFMNASRR